MNNAWSEIVILTPCLALYCSDSTCTWNFHLCPNRKISWNSPLFLVVYKAWKGMWKEWEFCSCSFNDNVNVQLYMRIYVDGTFYVMDDGHMLLGRCFSKGIVIGILNIHMRPMAVSRITEFVKCVNAIN